MMRERVIQLGCVISTVAALSACTADIGGGNNGNTGAGGPGGGGSGGLIDTNGDGIPDTPAGAGTGPGISPTDPNAVGPMPLRRLNRREYNNTVRDLLGTALRPADDFPADLDATYTFPRAGIVATLDAEHIQEAAEALVAEADVSKLLPCMPAGDEAGCAKQFIEKFGLKAFRRPLVADEIAGLTALYEKGRGALMLDFNGAIKLVLEGMLQAPGFLYRWELGPTAPTKEGPLVKLTPYEIASRVSYFVLRSTPDQALLDAAAAGTLSSDADISAQVERLLGTTPAHESVSSFFLDWLKMTSAQIAVRDKDTELYPEWSPDLATAMAKETTDFVASILWGGDGSFTSLLTSPASSASGPLAQLYGATGTSLNTAQRSGLLTRAGFLSVTGAANGSHPVKRGIRIYRELLCKELIPPPGLEIPPAEPASAGGTTRDRFKRHEENQCAACHLQFDSLGFAFENYDGIGKYRTMDNNLPVDSTGTLTLDGNPVSFANGMELSNVLAQSAEVKKCFATQWVRYALDRNETEYDTPTVQAAATAFASGNIPALLKGVAVTRSFRYRTVAAGEITK
jgi:hypothetical protein